MGVAPVITDIDGNRDLVIHNKTGLVVPIRDANAIAQAVLKLRGNPALKQRFGDGSKERIQNVLSHCLNDGIL